jgi:riboflavin biosynthesis pyrimidine reductase
MNLREVSLWIQEPIAVPPLPISATPRIYVQGGVDHLVDFLHTLRAELQALGVTAEIVQREENYDYTVVLVQDKATAAAVALDRQGVLIASAVAATFRVRTAIDGAARKLARRMVPVSRDS